MKRFILLKLSTHETVKEALEEAEDPFGDYYIVDSHTSNIIWSVHKKRRKNDS